MGPQGVTLCVRRYRRFCGPCSWGGKGWKRKSGGAIAARVMNPGQADLRFYARDGEERGAGDLFHAVEDGLMLIHQEYPGCVVIVPENEQKGETV